MASVQKTLNYTCLELQGTGTKIPQIGLGTWLSDPGKVYEAVKVALDEGYRHIDEAWIYMNEEEVGKALKEKFAEGTVKREDVFVTSKLWNNFHRPELVVQGVKESLDKLGLEYLDLYLIHFPVSFIPGCNEATSLSQVEQIPLKDTWAAMEKLVADGLVKNIGVSNFEIEHIKEIQSCASLPIACNQFETQPYYQRNELVNYCHKHGIVVVAHTSLGSPGNCMSKHHSAPPLMSDPVINGIAEAHQKTAAHVLLRWALQRPTVVIPKSVTPARIASNAELFDFELSSEEMEAIHALDKPNLEGCYNHPKTPWLGRSDFVEGQTAHYCNE